MYLTLDHLNVFETKPLAKAFIFMDIQSKTLGEEKLKLKPKRLTSTFQQFI